MFTLLRFTFENHKSFKDEVDLTLVRSGVGSSLPGGESWVDQTCRVAAIYGANASGKSTVLNALGFMRDAVASSARVGHRRRGIPAKPFLLDDTSAASPSSYILDFLHDGVRYEYGFALASDRIEEEWLYSYPVGRKRIVFERGAGAGNIDAGRALKGGGPALNRATGELELALSRGALLTNPLLLSLRNSITQGISIAQFGEVDRNGRLRAVIEDVASGDLSVDDLRIMLRVADIGITSAEVQDEKRDPRIAKIIRATLSGLDEEGSGDEAAEVLPTLDAAETEEMVEKILSQVAHSLMFEHRGVGTGHYLLPTSAQSTGTLTWLSLAAPAIKTIREGGVLAVDELDASLHPLLGQVMIQMFRDPSVNRTGAQLLFTTHDTYFFSPSSEAALTPDEVWFTEKSELGVSDLYRLSDYPTRSDYNLSRRYLQGRYGAIPSVAPAFLQALVDGDTVPERDDSE